MPHSKDTSMANAEFPIAHLPVGEGTLAISPCPGVKTSYAHGLQTLITFAPSIVISMTTLEEMRDIGAQSLPEDLARNDIKWLHFSVQDYDAASPEAEPIWAVISQTVRIALGEGQKVLVHCKGGCGRSGMVALRIMVEHGEDPQAALTRLRDVRPCACETKSQTDWAIMIGQ